MDCSMPGFPVHHHLPEFAQVRVHCIGNDIQPAHPLSSPSSPAIILSQHQGLFQIQFSSVTQPWLTLCNPMNRSMPGLPVHHNSQSPPKPISIALVMPSNHLILCHPLLLLPSNFPSIKVFSNESIIRIRWPKYWSLASTSVPPMNAQDWSPNNKLTEYNYFYTQIVVLLLLLLLSRFSRVRLCATPEAAAHQAPPSLGFSRQEQWSGLPFPSPTHASEKWKWRRSTASDS